MEFQAVIMAAGRGSRMTSLTANCAKALLPIANMPMIWYPVQLLERAGFEEALVVVLETQLVDIQKALVDICDVKLRLDFVTVPDEDLGTADSLRYIKDKIKTDLLVISCDLISDLKLHLLADLHRTHDATVTILTAGSPDVYGELSAPGGSKASKKIERDFLGLDERGSRLLFLSSEADFEETVPFKKSILKKHPCINIHTRLVDGHLYLMKKWVLDFLQQDRSISTIKGELIPYLVRKQFAQPKPPDKDAQVADASVLSIDTKVDIYSFAEEDEMTRLAREFSSWNDHRGDMEDCYHGDKIRCYTYVMQGGLCLRSNTLATYCEANKQVPKNLVVMAPGKELAMIHPTASIQPKSQVGSDSMIGEGVTISERVGVKKSIIGKHCSIGEKVKITNSIIMDHVTIQEGSNLQGCIIGHNTHINQKCELKDCLVGSSQSILAMGKYNNETIVDLDRMMEI